METAEVIVTTVGAYLAVGVLVAATFVAFGAGRIDAAASGAGVWFRIAVFPGCVGLWPVVLGRWLSGRRINTGDHHRAAAE